MMFPVRVRPGRDSQTNGLYELLEIVKPEWEKGGISAALLSGGYINDTWLCSYKGGDGDGDGDNKKLVIRVNPDDSRMPYVDRAYEAIVVQHLHEKQLVAKYYGKFENGMVYEYTEGHNPSKDEMQREDILRLIIDKLYRVHTCGVPKNPTTYSPDQMASVLYHYISEVMESVQPSKFSEDPEVQKILDAELPPKAVLCAEAAEVRGHMDVMYRKFPHVYCHQDLWNMNIVYDEKLGRVEFIDWEMGDYAPVPMDLALLVDVNTDESVWRKVIQLYFERAGLPLDEDVMEDWYLCMLYTLSAVYLGCLSWGLWNNAIQKEGTVREKFFFDLVIDNIKGYRKLKSRWPK